MLVDTDVVGSGLGRENLNLFERELQWGTAVRQDTAPNGSSSRPRARATGDGSACRRARFRAHGARHGGDAGGARVTGALARRRVEHPRGPRRRRGVRGADRGQAETAAEALPAGRCLRGAEAQAGGRAEEQGSVRDGIFPHMAREVQQADIRGQGRASGPKGIRGGPRQLRRLAAPALPPLSRPQRPPLAAGRHLRRRPRSRPALRHRPPHRPRPRAERFLGHRQPHGGRRDHGALLGAHGREQGQDVPLPRRVGHGRGQDQDGGGRRVRGPGERRQHALGAAGGQGPQQEQLLAARGVPEDLEGDRGRPMECHFGQRRGHAQVCRDAGD